MKNISLFLFKNQSIYKTDYNALDFTSRVSLTVWGTSINHPSIISLPIDEKETLELIFEHGEEI